MPSIEIERVGDMLYRVTVEEGGTKTQHDVTVRPEDVARFAPGVDPERLLEASFLFLLDREPKEAILRRFELPVIARYFPDYPARIKTAVVPGAGSS